MNTIQFLSCSDIGTCCGNYALVGFLDTCRSIIQFIQLIAPIILLVAGTIQLVKMVVNPEEKNGLKKFINKFLAAAIIFFIPILFDASIGVLPDNFTLSACWNTAKTVKAITTSTSANYIELDSDKKTYRPIFDYSYEKGTPNPNTSGNFTPGVSGVGGQRMVNIALAELGNNDANGSHHKYESFSGLDDSQPWCAAFVTWVAGQAGYLDKGIFPRFVGCTSQYRLFLNMGATEHLEGSGYNPVAGDIIFYGNATTRYHVGIVISSDASHVYTIEGNTGAEGEAVSKCGGASGCVSKKTKSRPGSIYSYVTPRYPSS